MKHTGEILTTLLRQLSYLLVAKIVSVTVNLSCDVRMANYSMRVEETVNDVAKKRRQNKFLLRVKVPWKIDLT